MNYLVIDAGNTRSKLAVFSSGEIVVQETVEEISLLQLQELVATYNPEGTILSSVVQLDSDILSFIDLLPDAMRLDAATSLPIINKYGTPQTLGNDRLANAVGAAAIYPGSEVLIIDAGTCIKYDFITRNNEYLGGAISPGLQMRYDALHYYTDQLPALHPTADAELIGNSTVTSIHSGVINGMLAEIHGIIDHYESRYAKLQLILTGGDCRYFLNHIKKTIFVSPDLTLKGLHSILVHNYPR